MTLLQAYSTGIKVKQTENIWNADTSWAMACELCISSLMSHFDSAHTGTCKREHDKLAVIRDIWDR